MKTLCALLMFPLFYPLHAQTPDSLDQSLFTEGSPKLFFEQDGLVAAEAEHFYAQTHTDIRSWKLTTPEQTPQLSPDGDENHAATASGNAYLEILPDTRRTHDDKLIRGENFSPEPGQMAILHYRVHINTPGRYYVWVRCYSTGTEDNGIHVGLDGEWPYSGKQMQWCDGKNSWRWDSKQRTQENHCGEPYKIFLDIETPGLHTISFSMREDGFEFDKWLMTTDREFVPQEKGPEERTTWRHTSKEKPVRVQAPKQSLPVINGEKRVWHRLTFTFEGPFSHELAQPNPFIDYRFEIQFSNGDRSITVPGYFAADGRAGESSATQGNKWRAHFMPDEEGEWTYEARFTYGPDVALQSQSSGKPCFFHGSSGSFHVSATNKVPPDFRGQGALQYVGKRYLQFTESKDYFIKGGADSPENWLAYFEFDQTRPSHHYHPHARDWRLGDSTWKQGKGKNIIGMLNYLAEKGMNSVYFLTMNVTGDGNDVWPWVDERARFRFDCSKLDQWETVFQHMDRLGIMMHVITQETENDQLLDGGDLGPERMLYYRELIARYSHHPAMVWNFGEENTNTTEQLEAFIDYFAKNDPYQHPVVVHTYPDWYDRVYEPLLGLSGFHGPSLQMKDMSETHSESLTWIERSAKAGHPWFVCLDEVGPARTGVKPDADDYWHDEVRRHALWGNLMAGGAGVEWYMGYHHAHNDINCEDWRSRDHMWDLTRYALQFFQENLPFAEMQSMDDLTTHPSDYCFADPGEVYAVYLPDGKSTDLDLQQGAYQVKWYSPMTGETMNGSVSRLNGPGKQFLGNPPLQGYMDWVVLVERF